MKGETEVYNPGQMIFREGDPSGGIYFVKEGRIEIFRERDGLQVSLGFSNPGDILGTVTIFSRDPRSASARAISQATVLHVGSESLEAGFKDVPVWAQAVLKDAVARLKFVDEKLVDAKLFEKKLIGRVGTPYQHAAQMAAFLASLVATGTISEDGVVLFPLKGFVPRCELVILRRAEYLESVFRAFTGSGLVKVVEDKKWGPSVSKPKAQLLEEFAVFCLQASKQGQARFAPPKLYPWMSALVRLGKKIEGRGPLSPAELAAELSKEMGRSVSEAMVGELVAHGVVRTSGGDGKIAYNAVQINRRIVFENTCRLLKECKDGNETEAGK